MSQSLLTAAQLLLDQFTDVANQIVKTAVPQKDWSAATFDRQYESTLRGLKLLAHHHAPQLANKLVAWRHTTYKEIEVKHADRAGHLEPTGVCKRAMMDVVCMDAALQLLVTLGGDDLKNNKDLSAFYDGLQGIAFSWLVEANKHIPQEAPSMLALRAVVVERAARVLGGMSRIRLLDILAVFIRNLEERLSSREQAVRDQVRSVCTGMHHVQLSFDSTAQLKNAIVFLDRCNPFKYTSQHRRSQIHHAMCEMLTSILAPLVHADLPHSCTFLDQDQMVLWYNAVHTLHAEVWTWTTSQNSNPLRENKHIPVGYLLVTSLVCLSADDRFLELTEQLAELLSKQIKQKDHRALCMRCLNQLAYSYLLRNHSNIARAEVTRWLERWIKPAFTTHLKRGVLLPDHQELVLVMCSSIAELHPAYAISSVIVELLGQDAWECCVIGLRVLASMLLSIPEPAAATANGTKPGGVRLSLHNQQPVQVVELLRRGQHPMELQGVYVLLAKVQAALAKLLSSCQTLYGGYMAWTAEPMPKEKLAGLPVFPQLLKLVPYTKPDQWPTLKLLDLLPQFTAHCEGQVRSSAAEALLVTMRASPSLRNGTLARMATFITTIPDNDDKTIRECVALLRRMMDMWQDALQQHISGEFYEAEAPESTEFEQHRVEGPMVALLAHPDPSTRLEALSALALVRKLHKTLRYARTLAAGSRQRSPLRASSPSASPRQSAAGDSSHGKSFSRDSIDFRLLNGHMDMTSALDDATYMIDVIEEAGGDIVQRCYWNFGDWSDLWREWKPVPEDASFQKCMLADDEISKLRWARILSELARTASPMCVASTAMAHAEVMFKLGRLMPRDVSSRPLPPPDNSERCKLDAWRSYVMFAVGCSMMASGGYSKDARRVPLRTNQEVLRLLMAQLGSTTREVLAASSASCSSLCCLALGHCHPDYHAMLLEELPACVEEHTKTTRVRAKILAVRVAVANIMRALVSHLAPRALSDSLTMRSRLLEWLRDTTSHMRSVLSFSDAFWDEFPIAFCLACVARNLAPHIVRELSQPVADAGARSGPGSAPPLRKALFELFAGWCEEGLGSGSQHRAQLALSISAAVQKSTRDSKELGAGDALRAELTQNSELLDHAARTAMAAMVKGPVFDNDARRPQGPVLSWIDRLLMAAPSVGARLGPSKAAVARQALSNLLQHNGDLFTGCINRCYNGESPVSTAYFQVLAEVYALQPDVQCEPHILLSLLLYKIVDGNEEVREDAQHMLSVMKLRAWGDPGMGQQQASPQQQGDVSARSAATSVTNSVAGDVEAGPETGGALVVLGKLQDSYQQFQYELSAKLARDHPELSEQLCEEMMTRQLEVVDSVTQHPVLTCLAPWMENLSIHEQWKGTWCERLLKSMYYVTLRHGGAFPLEIERLWSTLAHNKSNIVPILDFLISLGAHAALQEMHSLLEYFAVGKRISLYLARISPAQTIEHLVAETARLVQEDEGPQPLPDQAPPYTDSPMEFSALAAGETWDRDSVVLAAMRLSQDGPKGPDSSLRASRNSEMEALGKAPGLLGVARGDSASSKGSPAMPSSLNSSIKDSTAMAAVLNSAPFKQVIEDAMANAGVRKAAAPNSPTLRPIMSRPELTTCLLTEIAYECEEDFVRHLATLFHGCVCLLDSEEALVASHAQTLLLYLINSMAAHYLERCPDQDPPPSCHQAMELIKYLQSCKGRRLWGWEEATLRRSSLPSASALAALVGRVVEAVFWDEQLQARWAACALCWATESYSRHLACRSLQVYRALQPRMTRECCVVLLQCLQQCFTELSTLSLEVAVELILTLKALVGCMAPSKLLLQPALFWTAMVLLRSDCVHIFQHALQLLGAVLARLQLGHATVQHVLLCSAPQGAAGSPVEGADLVGSSSGGPTEWVLGQVLVSGEAAPTCGLGRLAVAPPLAMQQLLVKGLLADATEQVTITTLTQLLAQLAPAWDASTPAHALPMPEAAARTAAPNPTPTSTSTSRRASDTASPSNSQGSPAGPEANSGGSRGLPAIPPLELSRQQSSMGASSSGQGQVPGAVGKRRLPQGFALDVLLGPRQAQLLSSLAGTLPYLCAYLQAPSRQLRMDEALAAVIRALAAGCRSQRYDELASRVAALESASPPNLQSRLAALCRPLAAAFFPQMAGTFLAGCVELLVVPRCSRLHAPVLLLLRCIFEVPGLQLGPAVALLLESQLLAPLTDMSQGPLGQEALEAINAIMAFMQQSSEAAVLRNSRAKMAARGEKPPPLPPQGVGLLTCSTAAETAAALQRVLATCSGSADRPGRQRLMPFLSAAVEGM